MRIKNRILCLFLSFVLLFSISVRSNAEIASSASNDAVETIINRYSFSDDTQFSIEDSFSLRSFTNNEELYTLYTLNPYGYAIFLNETGDFMEGCYQDNSFAEALQATETYYYGGPGRYYSYKEGCYFSLISDESLVQEDIQILAGVESRVHTTERANEINPNGSARGTIENDVSVMVQRSYFEGLTEHGQNVNGTCTVVATAILLGYYANFVNSRFVPTQYRDGNGTTESFHQLLNSYVYKNNQQGGIYIHDAVSGINSYLSSQGLGYRMQYYNNSIQANVINKMVSTLTAGRPLIASVGMSYGATYNHTMVIYGVEYNSTTSIMASAIFRVYMGWSAPYTAMSISGSWFYECGYIV